MANAYPNKKRRNEAPGRGPPGAESEEELYEDDDTTDDEKYHSDSDSDSKSNSNSKSNESEESDDEEDYREKLQEKNRKLRTLKYMLERKDILMAHLQETWSSKNNDKTLTALNSVQANINASLVRRINALLILSNFNV